MNLHNAMENVLCLGRPRCETVAAKVSVQKFSKHALNWSPLRLTPDCSCVHFYLPIKIYRIFILLILWTLTTSYIIAKKCCYFVRSNRRDRFPYGKSNRHSDTSQVVKAIKNFVRHFNQSLALLLYSHYFAYKECHAARILITNCSLLTTGRLNWFANADVYLKVQNIQCVLCKWQTFYALASVSVTAYITNQSTTACLCILRSRYSNIHAA